jgi:hypothetical protein
MGAKGGVTYLPAPPQTAGAAQRRGIKGAAALPPHDSGANPVRAQMGGRAQKGGRELACNRGQGSRSFSCSAKRAKGRALFMHKWGWGVQGPCVTTAPFVHLKGQGRKGPPLGRDLVPCGSVCPVVGVWGVQKEVGGTKGGGQEGGNAHQQREKVVRIHGNVAHNVAHFLTPQITVSSHSIFSPKSNQI